MSGRAKIVPVVRGSASWDLAWDRLMERTGTVDGWQLMMMFRREGQIVAEFRLRGYDGEQNRWEQVII